MEEEPQPRREKRRYRSGLRKGLPTEHPLETLVRQLDVGSVEEERGQNCRFGHYSDFMMLEPWVRVHQG